MEKKLIKTRFFKPYEKSGKTNLIFAQGRAGVYIIKKGEDIRYIGYSGSNVYKTAIRHFEQWNDKTQVRTIYKNLAEITIRIVLTTPGRAAKLERALIVKYQPKDNPDKLKGYVATPAENDIFRIYQEANAEYLKNFKDEDFLPF